MTHQRITTQGAEASYLNAKLAREVAEIALSGYREGVSKQEMQTALGEIAQAMSDRKRAEDRLERTRHAQKRLRDMLAKSGAGTPADIAAELDVEDRLEAAEQAVPRATMAHEQAQTKLEVLKEFTSIRTIRQLEGAVKKALSDEQARKATWEQEKAREAKLERQIRSCKIVAPADGVVIYANDPNRFGRGNAPQIEEGAIVRERQRIFHIPDLSGPMRVNVKVPESEIVWVTPGLRARIKVDDFADETLPGVVESVSPMADPSNFFNSGVKVYPTFVTIDKVVPGLAPGMTAQVEIQTDVLDDVLTVPVRSVVYYDGKDHVAVKKADGGFDWREVSLGLSYGNMVEVKQGLKSGEAVAVEPAPLLSERQRLKILHLQAQARPRPQGHRARRPGASEAAAGGIRPRPDREIQERHPRGA